LSRGPRGTKTSRGPRANQDSSAKEMSAVAVAGDERAAVDDGGATRRYDYFSDAVPLRGDRELRERDERMRRLEEARPTHGGRIPRLRLAIVLAVGAAVLATALSIISGSSTHDTSDSRSPAAAPRPITKKPSVTRARIGLGPAVAVAVSPSRHQAQTQTHRRRSSRSRQDAPEMPSATSGDSTPPAAAPETVESEITTTESELEAVTAPEPESAPTTTGPQPDPGTSEASEGTAGSNSSTDEADREFGFGR
jgi:hypothetical protein